MPVFFMPSKEEQLNFINQQTKALDDKPKVEEPKEEQPKEEEKLEFNIFQNTNNFPTQ